MVAHFTMRTHGVNQAFRFVEDIWLHWKSCQIRFFFRKKTLFSLFVRNVKWATIYIKIMPLRGEFRNISFNFKIFAPITDPYINIKYALMHNISWNLTKKSSLAIFFWCQLIVVLVLVVWPRTRWRTRAGGTPRSTWGQYTKPLCLQWISIF